MRKVDLVQQPVRPCNFNDFYYFKNMNLKRVAQVVLVNK